MTYKDPEKQKAAVRRLQDDKRAALYKYKEETPCADCGGYFHHSQMEFDHLGDKSFTIGSRSASFGSEEFMAELAKCELVCANCHRLRTWNRYIASLADTVKARA